ncbi:hypothetical protein [Nocardia cyriacigeorgica]|uniref:hypothetical protein n=1 Tax=Nocardia cyriacigeorgica TaxID=135487 RepID=UPI0024582B36|nr:hypothetical protein [Nocardia cyriacigeorgica]
MSATSVSKVIVPSGLDTRAGVRCAGVSGIGRCWTSGSAPLRETRLIGPVCPRAARVTAISMAVSPLPSTAICASVATSARVAVNGYGSPV